MTEEFGEKLYLKGEGKLCLSQARHLLVLGDDDPWIKNIETAISRRFKKHGLSWTTNGDNNLLTLRTLCYNMGDWSIGWAGKEY